MMITSDGLRDEQPWLKILRKTMKLNMVRCQFSVVTAGGKPLQDQLSFGFTQRGGGGICAFLLGPFHTRMGKTQRECAS